jgi:hypothetical protein
LYPRVQFIRRETAEKVTLFDGLALAYREFGHAPRDLKRDIDLGRLDGTGCLEHIFRLTGTKKIIREAGNDDYDKSQDSEPNTRSHISRL